MSLTENSFKNLRKQSFKFLQDQERLTPYVQRIAAIKDSIIIEKILKEKKVDSYNLKQQLNKEWDDLYEKQQSLKDKFIKYDQFIKDNSEKRKRTNKKIGNCKNKQKEKLDRITDFKRDLNYLNKVKYLLEKECENLKIFQIYLDTCVMEETNKYKEPLDILNKYSALINTKKNLILRQETITKNIDDLNDRLNQLVEEYDREYFTLHKEKFKLEEKLNQIKKTCLKWEYDIYKTKIDIEKHKSDEEKLVQGCWNICVLINNKIKQSLPSSDNLSEQLSFIQHGIVLLRKIIFLSKYFGKEDGFIVRAIDK